MYVFVYVYVFIIVYWESRNSSVSTATRYGLEGPGFEFRCGTKFSAPFHIGPEAYPAPYTMGTGSFPGVKRPGHDFDHLLLEVSYYICCIVGRGGLDWLWHGRVQFWLLFTFCILLWFFFILLFYMVYNVFFTYRVYSGPLGVGYRAMRISDSGCVEYFGCQVSYWVRLSISLF